MTFNYVQRRLNQSHAKFAMFVVFILAALVVFVFSLFLLAFKLWRLSAARPVAGALSKPFCNWELLIMLQVRVSLIFEVNWTIISSPFPLDDSRDDSSDSLDVYSKKNTKTTQLSGNVGQPNNSKSNILIVTY